MERPRKRGTMRTPFLAELLLHVSLPHWRDHRLRTLLTVVGVALGVASVVGIADVSATVLASFRHMVETMGGGCPLEVVSPSGGVREDLIERVAAVRGVKAAAGVIEGFIPLVDHPDETLYLVGLDFLGSPVWEQQFPRAEMEIEDELEFVSKVDSVALPAAFLARHGWSRNDTFAVLTAAGPRTLRIRGVLGAVAPAQLFDGAMAVMDLPAAQRLLARDGEVDRVAVELEPDADVDAVRRVLETELGAGVEVTAPEARGRQAEHFLLSLRTMLATMSAVAIIVGTLIVFHTVAVSVEQRRRQFALLHVAGVSPRMLTWLCLTETALLTVVGIVLGLGGGWLLGRLGGGLVANVSEIWLRIDVQGVAHSRAGELTGVIAAAASALGASYVAIRATFQATTVEALRPTPLPVHEGHLRLKGLLLPATLVAGSWLILLAPPGLAFAPMVALIVGACVLGYLGGALIAPGLVLLAGLIGKRVCPYVGWLPVQLALDNLPRDPRRSGATVGTIIVAMAIAANVAGTVASFNAGILDWTEQHFASDLMVGAGARVQFFGGNVMDVALADTLRDVPGVASVEPFRVRRISLNGRPVFLQGVSIDERLARGGLPMVEGSFADAVDGLRAGTGVLLSDNLAFRLGLHKGDTITLSTLHGDRTFRVEGTYTDYVGSIDLGAVVVDATQLVTLWDDRLANLFRIWLTSDAAPGDVRRILLRRLGADRGYYVITAGQFLERIRGLVRGVFHATWTMQVVAALIGVIGVVNAQLATVLDRAGEIRTMRTIGVSSSDITRSTVVECALLGVLGGLGGVALGTMLSAEIVTVALRLLTGWQLPFTVALAPLAGGVAAAAVVSAAAGWVPARAVARLEGAPIALD